MKKQENQILFVGFGFMSPEIIHLEPSYCLKGKTEKQKISLFLVG